MDTDCRFHGRHIDWKCVIMVLPLNEADGFLDKYKLYMEYFQDMAAYKRKKVSPPAGNEAEINWTDMTASILYRVKFSDKVHLYATKKEMMKAVREHSRQVDWASLFSKKDEWESSADREFLMELINDLQWMNILLTCGEEINEDIFDFMEENNLVDWKAVSVSPDFPASLLIKYPDRVDWMLYLSSHNPDEIPVELMDIEELLIAVRNNPDLMNLKGNRENFSEINDRLKRFVWVDRMDSYQDDTGLWVDDMDLESLEKTTEDEKIKDISNYIDNIDILDLS